MGQSTPRVSGAAILNAGKSACRVRDQTGTIDQPGARFGFNSSQA